ncbi:MAG TPA: PKD domain-containing protein [Ferruginibacter sp.]|nr:PKD domain-containing protein [Ferruginibacter sp.]
MKNTFLTAFLLLFTQSIICAQQYTVNGNAIQQSCNCYRLTANAATQSGSVWNNIQINLNNSFDFNFDVYLGTNNSPGADGIAFVLQPISTSVGSSGGGMGVQGISPSIAVTLDTYQNTSPDSDPSFDHIAFQRNGDINHASANNLAGPVQASASNVNIEDGQTHKLRVVWDAVTKTLTAYFNGIQRLSLVNDIVATTFGGNPNVFWGFTGATGGEWNEQRFCTSLSPAWNFLPTQKRCVGEPIQFVDSTISFSTIVKMYWNFGDGSNIDSVNVSPIHTYTAAGSYIVTQRVVGADGCEQTNTQTIIVGSKPFANFSINDSCVNNNIQFTSTSFVSVGTINNWFWDFDNAGLTSTMQNPITNYASGGTKIIKHIVRSLQGCESDTLYKPIEIYARPQVDFSFTDSVCLGSPTIFSGQILSNSHPIQAYAWNLGDTSTYTHTTQNTSYIFSTPGAHTVMFLASSTGNAGCLGFIQKSVFVVDKPRAAIRSFSGCEDVQVTLQDSSFTLDGLPVTQWWWDLGNGNFSTQQNPSTIYNTGGTFNIQLVVWNSKGCRSDTLRTTINVFAKPIIDFTLTDSCVGNLIQLNGFISNGSGNALSWYWFLDNAGATSTQQNPTTTYTIPGIKNIQLFAISLNGCPSDTLYKSINIYDKPVVDFSFQDSVCLGTTINFTGTVTGSANPITNWQWTFDGANPATTQNTSYTFTTPGNHTVSFSASTTGVSSCYGPVVQKTVFIADKPKAAIRPFLGCQAVATQLFDSSYTLDGLPITQWWWDLGNGNFSTQQNPMVTYTNSGIIDIQLVVWNSRGCQSDTLKISIKVYTTPLVDFVFDNPACDNSVINFTDVSVSDTTINSWIWSTASTIFSTQQHPSHSFNAGTTNTVSLVVTNSAGCVSATMQHSFVMKIKPKAAMQFSDACKLDDVIFTANETTGNIGIVDWFWNFGDAPLMVNANPATHTYHTNGNYPVTVYGISTEGCPTDTISRPITIYGTDAFAGNDVIAAPNQPVQLNATGGLSYQWTPTTGLSASNIPNPVAINTTDKTYYLKAFTPEGCESFDTIQIKIYKGPEIYVPTAFSPNGDGRNDILKPLLVGISSFEYFAVYNRYGEMVFKSSDPNRGWDGTVKGQAQHTGSFVWMVAGIDFTGKKIFKKGTVVLIK